MVKIIFSRIGKKKQPHYRIIALHKKKDPWGTFLEIIGHYNPRTKETILMEDRIKYWLDNGAQPSDTVHNLLVTKGLIKADKVGVTTISKKRRAKLDAKNQEAKAKAEAAAQKEAEAKAAEPVAEPAAQKEAEAKPVEPVAEPAAQKEAEAKPVEPVAKPVAETPQPEAKPAETK